MRITWANSWRRSKHIKNHDFRCESIELKSKESSSDQFYAKKGKTNPIRNSLHTEQQIIHSFYDHYHILRFVCWWFSCFGSTEISRWSFYVSQLFFSCNFSYWNRFKQRCHQRLFHWILFLARFDCNYQFDFRHYMDLVSDCWDLRRFGCIQLRRNIWSVIGWN